MTWNLDLYFRSPKKDEHIFTPFGHIRVKRCLKDKQGRIFLTPDCLTKREIDEQVDRLIQELEDVRKKAKKKFEH